MLNIDKAFQSILESNSTISSIVAGRIYNTGRLEKDETADKVPYIIITYDGGSSDEMTKDDVVAPITRANVSILCCATTRNNLSTLTEAVEDAILSGLNNFDWAAKNWGWEIVDAVPTASSVALDPTKPCYFETITYQCDTIEL